MASERARQLRKNLTDAEEFIWKRIRGKQLAGFRFRRQHPIGPFITDFVCLEQMLILELDGDQHAEQLEYDERRTRWLNERGYRVIRFPNFQVFTEWDAVSEEIYRLLTAEGLTPHPNPPPQGGREQEVARG